MSDDIVLDGKYRDQMIASHITVDGIVDLEIWHFDPHTWHSIALTREQTVVLRDFLTERIEETEGNKNESMDQ